MREREFDSLTMEAKQPTLSILMFPWIGHSHVSSYLELAKTLTKHNFTIFLCSTPIILKSIHQNLQNTPITLVELHLPSQPELPPHLHTTKHAPRHLMPLLLKSFSAAKTNFSAILATLKPNLLIYDGFQPWAATAAAAIGIPAIHFATTSAAAYAFFYHHSTKKDSSAFPYEAIYLRSHEWRKLQSVKVAADDGKFDGFSSLTLSRDVVLMKTSRGLEGKYVDYFSLLCKKKIICVGPLTTRTITTLGDDDVIMEWLSKKEKLSTVFISLGSENYLSNNQIQEMAKGLEASNANFVWVVRFPQGERVDIEETLPLGFLERVGERGKIVEGWAPQTKILEHSSVFAFVSHCGPNSMIESVYCRVPIVGIPVNVDQPLIARVLVEAGVGVEVERDENGDFRGEEVAVAIGTVRERGEEMRVRLGEMSEIMKKEEEYAVAEHLRRICMDYSVDEATIS